MSAAALVLVIAGLGCSGLAVLFSLLLPNDRPKADAVLTIASIAGLWAAAAGVLVLLVQAALR